MPHIIPENFSYTSVTPGHVTPGHADKLSVTTTPTQDPHTVLATLEATGLTPRRSGAWLRIPAIWRGGSGYNVSVHSVSGAWRDHATGEHGAYSTLCALLKTSPATVTASTARRTAAKPVKRADQWLAEGFGRSPLPDLTLHDLHGLTAQQKIIARHRRQREQSDQVRVWDVIRRHLGGRLPGIDFDPLDCLPTHARASIGGHDGTYRLILPILGYDSAGRLGPDGAHVTNLIQHDDGITKGTPKSFTPAMPDRQRHQDSQHVPLIRRDTPAQTLSVPDHTGPLFAVAEGLETTFSGMTGAGVSGIAALTAGRLDTLLASGKMLDNLSVSGGGLLVFADRDPSKTGQIAGARLVTRARAVGIPAWLLLPPLPFGDKADWNDIHQRAGVDGLRAAVTVAMDGCEAALSEWAAVAADSVHPASRASVMSLDIIRDAEGPASDPVVRISLDEATARTASFIRDFLGDRGSVPRLLAADPGTGKSHILATMARDMQAHPAAPSLAVVTPTIDLADAVAGKAHGRRRHGRSGDQDDAGYCHIHPEIEPYSEQWRSVVAHKCRECPHGQAAMDLLRPGGSTGDLSGVEPCHHLLHLTSVRAEPVATMAAAGFEGDPTMELRRVRGLPVDRRRMAFDDVSDLADHRMVRPDQISAWIRAARWASSQDRGSADKKRIERGVLCEKAIPELQRLVQAVAGHDGEQQVRIDPQQWTVLIDLATDPVMEWMDATAAEAVHADAEGKTEIPLRALKGLALAIRRGTAWLQKGVLLFAAPTSLASAVTSRGAMIMDATPSPAVRDIVEALGGQIEEVRLAQDSLEVVQVLDGSHGKTVCESPKSQGREIEAFEYHYQQAMALYGADAVAALTHKAFAEAIRARHIDPTTGEVAQGWGSVGWFGRHNRGQNDWEDKVFLMVWGVPQLSPSLAERCYMADRQAVIEACEAADKAVPDHWMQEWDGTRAVRWARVPGQAKALQYEGYASDWIDQWSRAWTTAEIVQGNGRLRATRRTEPLIVELHGTFALTADYGMEIHRMERGGRTRLEYGRDRKADQQERAVIGIRAQQIAGAAPSYAKTQAVLHSMGLEAPRKEGWGDLLAGGSAPEYDLYQCGTGPVPLIPDDDLAAALQRLAQDGGCDPLEVAIRWIDCPDTPQAERIAAKIVIHHPEIWRTPPKDRLAAS